MKYSFDICDSHFVKLFIFALMGIVTFFGIDRSKLSPFHFPYDYADRTTIGYDHDLKKTESKCLYSTDAQVMGLYGTEISILNIGYMGNIKN